MTCRVYPVFVGHQRIEVRVHGLLAPTEATVAAIQAVVEAVGKAKQLGLAFQVVDPDVPQKVQP